MIFSLFLDYKGHLVTNSMVLDYIGSKHIKSWFQSIWSFMHWISTKFQDENLAPEFWCRMGETKDPAVKPQQNTTKKYAD